MLLSVIIVNYNVKYFLEQCLRSVEKALAVLEQEAPQQAATATANQPAGVAEVIVIDNQSPDNSLAWLKPRFPGVRFVDSGDNLGFSRANNQGLALARGKYILFLNPDTVIPEYAFRDCLGFLMGHPDAGGLGVRMIDGAGNFLPESSRGFPTAWASFCKMTGLTACFPHSRLFAGYYLGHLPPDQTHPAPVLSGACLMVSRLILERIGGFDERFFMYAEDIDLSCRIEMAGFTNYYYPEVTILHFKGESTRKDLRYIRLFYKAMAQFRRKHFRGPLNSLFNGLLGAAIWCRAAIAALISLLRPGPARKEGKGSPVPDMLRNFVLEGDPAAIARLRRMLDVQTGITDSGVILCEGEAFSFQQLIVSVEKNKGRTILVHAGNSDSLAGSSTAFPLAGQ